MATISPLSHSVAVQPANLQSQAPTGTIKKIIGVVFSILAVIAVAALRGVQCGLLVAGIGGVIALAISYCSTEKVQPQNPALIRNPQPDRMARSEAEDRHFRALRFPFDDTMELRLALIVHLGNMDLTQVQLLLIQNVSYQQVYKPMGGNFIEGIYSCEGYAVDLQTPNGPARYYVDLNGQHVTRPEDSQNVFAR